MQRLLSSDLWSELQKHAKKSRRRLGAIAYVTKDLLLFRRGDTLVVDASESAVRSGATHAPLLSALERKGVALYNHRGLHAKVLLFDKTAFVGSSNLSASSHTALVEAGLLTDSKTTLSQVESFIEQLINRSEPLDREKLRELCRIKVKRSPGPWFNGSRRKSKIGRMSDETWLVGVAEYDRDWTAAEEAKLEAVEKRLLAKYNLRNGAVEWIRWGNRGAFARKGCDGNRLIQIWSASDRARPKFVYKATEVLEVVKIGRSTFASITKPKRKMSWGAFKVLMKQLGNRRRFGGTSERILAPTLAGKLEDEWG